MNEPQNVMQINTSAHVKEVGDLLIDYLAQLGVEYIFGIPGGAIEPLYNALGRSARAGGMKPVVARHETGAAFMCDGYTSNTGILGVCCATTGPGSTNLVTGVASAYANQTPMLVLTAQTPLHTFGRGAVQDSSCTGIDTVSIFENITKYNTLISHIDTFEQKFANAIRMAYQSPQGPVHLSLPMDVISSISPVTSPSYDLSPVGNPAVLIDEKMVDKLFEILTSGQKVLFIIGDGCSEAIGNILETATLLNAYIVTTPHGKGLVSPYHPLYRGVIGFAGHKNADEAILDTEIIHLIAIGTRFGEWDSNGWDKAILNNRLLHIAEDSGYFSSTPMAKLHIQGNIKAIFSRVLDYLDAHIFNATSTTEPVAPTINLEANDGPLRNFTLDEQDKYDDNSTPIKPQRLMHDLPRYFPPNTRYLADSGASFAWAIHYLHPYDRRMGGRQGEHLEARQIKGGIFRACLEFSSMGWAVGASIGTALAVKNDPVVAITGDGSMLMSGQELTVALQHNLCVIFIVLNDSSLGMVKHGQKLTGAEQIATELPTISFAAIAEAEGIDSYTVRSPEELASLDYQLITSKKGPTLIDVLIDKNEVPPMGLRAKVLKRAQENQEK